MSDGNRTYIVPNLTLREYLDRDADTPTFVTTYAIRATEWIRAVSLEVSAPTGDSTAGGQTSMQYVTARPMGNCTITAYRAKDAIDTTSGDENGPILSIIGANGNVADYQSIIGKYFRAEAWDLQGTDLTVLKFDLRVTEFTPVMWDIDATDPQTMDLAWPVQGDVLIGQL